MALRKCGRPSRGRRQLGRHSAGFKHGTGSQRRIWPWGGRGRSRGGCRRDCRLRHLDPATVEAIGDALQTFYRALIEEPLPARLLALLAELEAKEGDDT